MPYVVRRRLPALVAGCLLLSVTVGQGAPRPLNIPNRAKPAARIDEMLEWLAREQQAKTGGFTWEGHAVFSAGSVQQRLRPKPPDVADTCLVALALLRTNNAPDAGPRKRVSAAAVAFVERVVTASSPSSLELSEQRTPINVRLGQHVDTFFALWLLAELRSPASPGDEGQPLVRKLIDKIERNINADGSWGAVDAALNSPMLAHAVGVRALETAARKGFKVNPEVVKAAGQFALTDAAKQREEAQSGKWKPDCGGFKPRWLVRAGSEDHEPINEAFYLSAARLSVIDQADRSNALEEGRIRVRLAEGPSNQELADVSAQLRAIAATRKTLATAREQMFRAFGTKRSAAPVLFCAEDYLAALLIVDAMGSYAVEQWFPPTVRAMMFIQDVDGALLFQEQVQCQTVNCRHPGPPNMPLHMCRMQRSFCSRDRVFCTAAGLALLVADTPYRGGFLDPKSVK